MRFLKQVVSLFIIPSIIGLLGGFSAILFRELINLSNTAFNLLSGNSNIFYVVLMPFVFLFTYTISRKLLISPENVTIDEIAKKISVEKGGFNIRKGILVLSLTSFNIGFGVPVGREGPIAKLGGVFSELFSKAFKIDRLHLPIYLTCGVSSALSATFNAPIAAILFGIEIVLGKINSYIVIPIAVSSSIATLISREFLGNFTAFYVPTLSFQDIEIPLFLIIAFISALASILFFSLLNVFSFFRIRYRKLWGKIAFLFGFIVGLLIYMYPEIAGVGYCSVTELFKSGFSPDRVLEIFISKFLAVVLSFGSGVFGGLLAPSIFMGSFLGYFIGSFSQFDPRVFALVGSSAFLSGISRAPFRSSLIVIELTHNYQLVIPTLITSILTNYLIGIFNETSLLKRALLHKGIEIDEIFRSQIKNLNIMDFINYVKPVYETSHFSYVINRFLKNNIRYLPVVKSPKDKTLVGIVSVRDLELAAIEEPTLVRVKEIMTPEPFALTLSSPPEEILKVVALFEVSQVPVVDCSGNYVGMFDVNKFLLQQSSKLLNTRKLYSVGR
jgi:CIC family chloride channel protein